jgi:hypothetical protein
VQVGVVGPSRGDDLPALGAVPGVGQGPLGVKGGAGVSTGLGRLGCHMAILSRQVSEMQIFFIALKIEFSDH